LMRDIDTCRDHGVLHEGLHPAATQYAFLTRCPGLTFR
jgi:hypothetical protein